MAGGPTDLTGSVGLSLIDRPAALCYSQRLIDHADGNSSRDCEMCLPRLPGGWIFMQNDQIPRKLSDPSAISKRILVIAQPQFLPQ